MEPKGGSRVCACNPSFFPKGTATLAAADGLHARKTRMEMLRKSIETGRVWLFEGRISFFDAGPRVQCSKGLSRQGRRKVVLQKSSIEGFSRWEL